MAAVQEHIEIPNIIDGTKHIADQKQNGNCNKKGETFLNMVSPFCSFL